jgi:hypothetical protein
MRPWDMLVADAEALLGFYTRAHVRERMCDCWACVAQTWPDRFGAALRAAAARIEALPSWAALAWKECALAAASRRELELPMVASSVDSALESIVYRLSAGSSRWGAPLSEYRYTDAIDRAFGYKCVVMCETAVRRVLDLFPNNPRQFSEQMSQDTLAWITRSVREARQSLSEASSTAAASLMLADLERLGKELWTLERPDEAAAWPREWAAHRGRFSLAISALGAGVVAREAADAAATAATFAASVAKNSAFRAQRYRGTAREAAGEAAAEATAEAAAEVADTAAAADAAADAAEACATRAAVAIWAAQFVGDA